MGGGKYDYAKNYAKYKAGQVSDSDFEKYVDSQGDLSNAWKLVDAYNKGENLDRFKPLISQNGLTPAQQAEYWIKRGATSKSAFGRAHAAEDAALHSGNYQGGTKVKKGTDAYDDYFSASDTGDTRFTDWLSTKGRGDNGNGNGDDETPWGNFENVYHPMLVPEYDAPQAQDLSSFVPESSPFGGDQGLLYQPWTSDYQQQYVPESLWNYEPPQLDVGVPKYIDNPFGKLELPPDWEELLNGDTEKNKSSSSTQQQNEAEGAEQQTEQERFQSGLETGTGAYGHNPNY